MLSRRLSAGRAGERLQAALAGLQELHLLRDTHRELVGWALQLDREEPVTSLAPQGPQTTGEEEQRLEATLATLKQQLFRLQKQDVGLKTHLQQLDQQISELKLDVGKASTEQLESDSRPSSGFYELSDGGSCSLSNSCTSVYSESLSSSQTSLLLPPTSPAVSQASPLSQVDVYRRRSADESSAQPSPLRATGLHLGSSRIRASAEQQRPRPVSTGDLDRMMGYYKSGDSKKSSVCPNLRTSTVDPKFQMNLVSRSGTEVYHFPSPLHAVALQSPIFYHGSQPTTPGFLEGQDTPAKGGPSAVALHQAQVGPKTPNYFDKLLQRSITKIQHETEREVLQTHCDYQQQPNEIVFPDVSQTKVPLPVQTSDVTTQENNQKRHCMIYSSQEPAENINHQQSVRTQEITFHCPSPTATREYSCDEATTSHLRNNNKLKIEYTSQVRSCSEKMCKDHPESRKGYKQRPVANHSLTTEENRRFDVHSGHVASPEFVHAQFVPAGSQKIKVGQVDRKTKAVKLRRKSSEKPRPIRQQHGYLCREHIREPNGGTKVEQRKSGVGKITAKCTSSPEEHKQGSGSDSSLCTPGLMYTHKSHPKPHAVPGATRSSKSRRFQCSEHEQLLDLRKRRQGTAKWLCNAETFQVSCSQQQKTKDSHSQAPGSRQIVRSMSAKTHSTQWRGPARSFQSSVSSDLFLHNLNARYPPAPYQKSTCYPPKCESEYSAECASLFHSTIAESSDGELSDHTTNRFGDSESSQSFQSVSDSDTSLSLDEEDHLDSHEEEGGLVWAEAALGQLSLQQLSRPEPHACRIKASRALKKKIRRFQPASMKVMTLV